jgi:hypothetical protein
MRTKKISFCHAASTLAGATTGSEGGTVASGLHETTWIEATWIEATASALAGATSDLVQPWVTRKKTTHD